MQISRFFSPMIFDYPAGCKPSVRERLLSAVDQYFVLGKGITLKIGPFCDEGTSYKRTFTKIKTGAQSSCPRLLTVIKVFSYMTVVIPVIMLIAKIILRYPYELKKEVGLKQKVLLLDETTKFRDEVVPRDEVKPHDDGVPSEPISKKLEKQHVGEDERDPDRDFRIPNWSCHYVPSLVSIQRPIDPDCVYNRQNIIKYLSNVCETISQGKKPLDFFLKEVDQNFLIFKIRGCPGLKIKALKEDFFSSFNPRLKDHHWENPQQIMQHEYNKILEVKEVLASSSYERLYLPKFSFVEVPYSTGKKHFILEACRSYYNYSDNEIVWKNRDSQLQPAFLELSDLINKTNLIGINPLRFAPLCRNGKWVLQLLNVTMTAKQSSNEEAPEGIKELMQQVYSEESLEKLLRAQPVAHQKQLEKIVSVRKEELAILHHHDQFHLSSETPPYSITQYLSSYLKDNSLDLEETALLSDGTVINMRDAILEVIEECNTLLKAKKFRQAHGIRAHCIYFQPVSSRLGKLGSQEGLSEDLSQLWLRKIFDSLVESKKICSWRPLVAQGEDKWNAVIEIWV